MKNLPWILIVLLSAILCIRQTGEPDVYWQIETGRYIIENLEVPSVDVFSYTYEGEEWTNVKWGTEVIMALVSDALGLESLMLMQFFVLLACIFFMFKTSMVFIEHFKREDKSLNNSLLLAFGIFLFFMSYRINGRPEMMSHLFTSIYFYLIVDYLFKPSKRIYWIVLLQLLWANMHEAYGVGMVMILIVMAGLILEKSVKIFNNSGQDVNKGKDFFIAGSIALIMPALHPMGPKMILYPFNIYSQLGENQFTTELFGFRNSEFWQYPAFIFIAVFIIALISLRSTWTSSKLKSWRLSIEQFGMPILLLFIAFFILGLQSFRNMPYFFFLAIPLLVLYFNETLNNSKTTKAILIGCFVLLYGLIGSGVFYKTFLEREKYGLRINPERTAIGAGKFLKDNNVGGKGFVDYLGSSYLLWYLDDFKTYIDLRDLDVFDQKFMENVLLSYQYPNAPVQGGKELFELMEEADNFNYAVITNKAEFKPILSYLEARKDYVLAYADPICTVFLKEHQENEDLIPILKGKKQSELFYKYSSLETPFWAKAISKLFWPFYSETDYSKRTVEKERFIHQKMIGK